MLNNIKSMIKEKTEFLEAAALIYEDGSGTNLDDIIVLGEESSDDEVGFEIDEKDNVHENDEENETSKEKDENDEDDNNTSDEKEDIMDTPINDEDNTDDAPIPTNDGNDDDVMDTPIDQPMPLPGDDLPTPVGAQTGEPINSMDDILNVEIDLGSNTVKDILPVPPANASEALTGDNPQQHVDSGFGGDTSQTSTEETDLIDTPVGESSVDIISSFMNGYNFNEAITIGDEPAAEDAAKDDSSTDIPAEETDTAADESEVTAAVRDKVSEADTDTPAGSSPNSKEDLLKKLGSITKSLEDAKKAVMNTIQ